MIEPYCGNAGKGHSPKALGRSPGSVGVLPYAALVAYYVVVFRLQVRRLNYAACCFNKHVLNSMTMFLVRRHWFGAVLRHKGRRSGREYATPVTAEPTEGGFVKPLTYGQGVDWLKNIRVAG
jgi:hypothetical protein